MTNFDKAVIQPKFHLNNLPTRVPQQTRPAFASSQRRFWGRSLSERPV